MVPAYAQGHADPLGSSSSTGANASPWKSESSRGTLRYENVRRRGMRSVGRGSSSLEQLESRGLSNLLNDLETLFGSNETNDIPELHIWKKERKPSSCAEILTSIMTSDGYPNLMRCYNKDGPRMNIMHTAVMMKKLARCVRTEPNIASGSSFSLWSSLLDKAMLLMPSAKCQQVVDMLSAVHLFTEFRERKHLGWNRALPPTSDERNNLELGTSDPDSIVDSVPSVPSTPTGLRPLHSSRSLASTERELVRLALRHSQGLLSQIAAGQPTDRSVSKLQQVLAAVGRLGMAPGDEWQDAFFKASERNLPLMDQPKIVALACGVSHIQPAAKPSPAWLSEFFTRSGRIMHTMEPRDLSIISTLVSRLPKPYPDYWVQALLQRTTECLDRFDAPAYALLLHSVGRMRKRTPKAWVQEVLETSAGLLYDFSTGSGLYYI